MARYIVRRLLQFVPLIIAISFISFLVLQLAPGDFTSALRADPATAKIADLLVKQYGLDKPWYVQYARWLGNALRLDFGYSVHYHVPVITLLGLRMWNTFLLSMSALVISWTVAIPLGIFAAVRRNSLADRLISLVAFAGISLPGFFVALLALLLAYNTGWFPIGGTQSPNIDLMTPWEAFLDRAHHLILPAVVLGLGGCAGILRQMRGSLLDTLRENYVMAARARGLSERVVIWKHAVRNAINPLITIFGFSLAGLLSGAALVENVTQWPGLGRLILEALQTRDNYLVMGSFVMGSVLLLLGNLIADVLLVATDPRIRVR
jgi:peptide/nickel transport system permease protein